MLALDRYPLGYSLLFIPFYSAAYTGNHWAVYNQQGQFWGYDDGDTTNGDYDYDSGDGLPSGCALSNPQQVVSDGVLDLAAPAPGPSLALAPGANAGNVTGNATALAPAPAGANSGNSTRQLVCKPLAAAVEVQQKYWTTARITGMAIGCTIVLVLLVLLLFCCLPACCSCKPRPKRQTETQLAAQHPQQQQQQPPPFQPYQFNDANCKV